MNRVFFEFNEAFQVLILRPVTTLYESFVPPPVKKSVSNFLANLKTPVILANDLLQGEGERAWVTTQRFAVNTTWGIGGLFDRAAEIGIERHTEDFGQTMAVWGVGEGFYLMLPVFGPSNPRDAVGKLLVDSYFDLFNMWANNTDRESLVYTRMGFGAVTEYGAVVDELDQIRKTSIDFYAALRSLYRQKRRAEIGNGADIQLPPIPDLGLDRGPAMVPGGNGEARTGTGSRPAGGFPIN